MSKIQKKFYLSEDVVKWLDQQIGNKSKIVEEIIRGAMGSVYRKKELKRKIDNDEAGSLEAIKELEEIERYKESVNYKYLFLECQDRVIREYHLNISNHVLRSSVRDGIKSTLDMNRDEVNQFIDNTISDYKNGDIDRLEIGIELKKLHTEKLENDSMNTIEKNHTEREIIRHESDGMDYNPFS